MISRLGHKYSTTPTFFNGCFYLRLLRSKFGDIAQRDSTRLAKFFAAAKSAGSARGIKISQGFGGYSTPVQYYFHGLNHQPPPRQ